MNPPTLTYPLNRGSALPARPSTALNWWNSPGPSITSSSILPAGSVGLPEYTVVLKVAVTSG